MATTVKVLRAQVAVDSVRFPQTTSFPWFRWDPQEYRSILLVVLVLGSALGVIYLKELNRQLLNEAVQLQKSREHLRADWGKLLLAEGVLAQQARVQEVAQNELKMQRPESNQIVMVSEVQ